MTEGNVEMLPCPTPDILNRIHCIDYFKLCDRTIDCPNAEDEDPTMCLFHSVVSINIYFIMWPVSMFISFCGQYRSF